MLWVSLLGQHLQAAPGDQVTSFDPTYSAAIFPSVYCMAVQADGKILTGGAFSGVNGTPHLHLARLNADGTLDTSFNANLTAPSGRVSVIIIQKDRKILIGGKFTHVHGVSRNGVARLNEDGTLDTNFDIGFGATNSNLHPYEVTSLALQPDGKVLVFGEFELFAGQNRPRLVRLNTDGSLEGTDTFNPPTIPFGNKLVLQSDGKILLNSPIGAGNFDTRLTRLKSNGSLDTSFVVPIQLSVNGPEMTLQPDGKILIYGDIWLYTGPLQRRGVMRLNSNGSMDLAFNKGVGPQGAVTGLALQADGKMIISGGFDAFATPTGTISRDGMIRLLPDGSVDTSIFTSVPIPDGNRFSMAQTPDGGILVADGSVYLIENDAGSETLKAVSDKEVQWLRSGALPEVEDVIFESSTDSGVTWISLGKGSRMAGGWKLAGLTLPAAGHLRASARTPFSGLAGANGGRSEKVVAFTIAPDIAVQATGAPDLVSGGTGIDFGPTPLDTPSSLTVTISNTGNLPLTGLTVAKSGTNAADFSLSSLASTPLAPGASRSLTVQFSPGDVTGRSAMLSFASNDPDENPFTITLTGTGTPAPGFIGFEKALYAVEEDIGVAALSLVRTQGTLGAVTISVALKNGTAKLDSDFSAASATITIPDGASSGTIMIPIANEATTEPAETFTMTLSNPTPTGQLAAIKTATVRIIDLIDTRAPTISITSPAANAVLNDPAQVIVTGTAGDNQGVERVEVSLNGAPPALALLDSPGNGTTRYSISLTPVTGLNTLSITSFDYQNNASSALLRQFTVARPLLVSLQGPSRSGTVSKGYSPSSFRKIGTAYAITATPSAGHFFEGWTANDWTGTGVTDDTRHLKKLSFTMVEGLQLSAHFGANPFPSVVGAFNGLVLPSSPTLPDTKANGFLTATVTSSGGFSGKLFLDGSTLPFSGSFDHDGIGRFGPRLEPMVPLTRRGKPSVVLTLKLDVPSGITVSTAPPILTLSGTTTVKDGVTVLATSTFIADRAAFSASSLVPPAYTPTGSGASAKGSYTVTFPAVSQTLALDGLTALTLTSYPRGIGRAFLTLSAKGIVSLSGTLADDTPITASAPLNAARQWPLFKQLYGQIGSLGGMVQFDTTATDSDLALMNGIWIKPPSPGQQYYPSGWPAGIFLQLIGTLYQPVAGTSILPGLPADDADGNANLTFSLGGLTNPVLKTAYISPADLVTNKPADTTFSLKITRTTGQISGKFPHEDGTTPAFEGVILTKGANNGGQGWFLSTKPRIINRTGQSGPVTLTPQ
jgi:uncharacterized delta-60 repeat protein